MERDCDRFALKLTHNPGAFISAFRKIADRNMADLRSACKLKGAPNQLQMAARPRGFPGAFVS